MFQGKIMIRIVLLAIIGLVSYFVGTSTHLTDNPEKEKVILETFMNVLSQTHFEPQKIDDKFSKEVHKLFISYLDGSKRYFTQSDIDELKKYELLIDDQINELSLEFFELALEFLENRTSKVEELFSSILAEPIEYKVEEYYEFDADNRAYCKDESELRELWRKMLKYDIINRMSTRIDQQEDVEEEEKRTLEQIEISAREAVLKTYQDWFKNFLKLRRSDRFELYLNAIAHAHDPHSDYYNPKEKQDFDISMGGKLEGIGARLRTEGDLTKVVDIVPGGPLWKSNEVEVNDFILAVKQPDEQPVDVFGMRIDDVVSMLRGKKGTMVTVTFRGKDGSTKDVVLERDVINIEESFAKSAVIDLDGVLDKVGYIDLPKFYSSFEGPDGNSCAVDVANEIEKLKKENVNGIILDLRNNGGGSLRDVVDMTGLFIKKGPIVQVKPNNRGAYIYEDEDARVQYTGPVVVLINSFSASASEILAAALQDYDRAIIVGNQSFGKGTVQRFVPLDRARRGQDEFKPLGEVKVTMQKFYRINGGSTQLHGVKPDIVLPDRYSYIDVGEREYPHAMPWSEIAALKYDQEVFKIKAKEALIKKSAHRIENNSEFNLINDQAQWLKSNRKKSSFPLKLEQFREDSKKAKEETEAFNKIMSEAIARMQVKNPSVDIEKISRNESTTAQNDSWKESIQKDSYIEEAIAIMADMIQLNDITKVSKEIKN